MARDLLHADHHFDGQQSVLLHTFYNRIRVCGERCMACIRDRLARTLSSKLPYEGGRVTCRVLFARAPVLTRWIELRGFNEWVPHK